MDLDTKLLSDKTPGSFTAKEVLRANCLDDVGVKALQLHLDGVCLVQAIILESGNSPGSLDCGTGLFNLVQKYPLDLSLVNKGCERISGVDETWATRPTASAMDTLFAGERIPECDIVNLSGLVGHDLALQAEVTENLSGTRLDTIGATCGSGNWAVVDVLNLVTPS